MSLFVFFFGCLVSVVLLCSTGIMQYRLQYDELVLIPLSHCLVVDAFISTNLFSWCIVKEREIMSVMLWLDLVFSFVLFQIITCIECYCDKDLSAHRQRVICFMLIFFSPFLIIFFSRVNSSVCDRTPVLIDVNPCGWQAQQFDRLKVCTLI